MPGKNGLTNLMDLSQTYSLNCGMDNVLENYHHSGIIQKSTYCHQDTLSAQRLSADVLENARVSVDSQC